MFLSVRSVPSSEAWTCSLVINHDVLRKSDANALHASRTKKIAVMALLKAAHPPRCNFIPGRANVKNHELLFDHPETEDGKTFVARGHRRARLVREKVRALPRLRA